jgi:UDP-2,3-diacylglucosamine pyrophosphatase LpxH
MSNIYNSWQYLINNSSISPKAPSFHSSSSKSTQNVPIDSFTIWLTRLLTRWAVPSSIAAATQQWSPSLAVRLASLVNQSPPIERRHHVRSVWISDLHLGMCAAQPEAVIDFLQRIYTERLYLVGDIFDLWQLRRTWYWPKTYDILIDVALSKVSEGTKIIYIPGNHDEDMRRFSGLDMGWLTIKNHIIHETADGRRLLVCHGDEFDPVVTRSRYLSAASSRFYDFLLKFDRRLAAWCNRRGWRFFSFATHLHSRVKMAVAYAGKFEQTMLREAQKQCLDGVICGHSHLPRRWIDRGLFYGNTGDWVESCTALTEDHKGRLRLVYWPAGYGISDSHPFAQDISLGFPHPLTTK